MKIKSKGIEYTVDDENCIGRECCNLVKGRCINAQYCSKMSYPYNRDIEKKNKLRGWENVLNSKPKYKI